MNFKTVVLAVAVALAAASAQAYTLRYKVAEPNAKLILTRLEAGTGLRFSVKCDTCTVNGQLMTGGGEVIVEVYQVKGKNEHYVPVPTITAALRAKINAAVLGNP